MTHFLLRCVEASLREAGCSNAEIQRIADEAAQGFDFVFDHRCNFGRFDALEAADREADQTVNQLITQAPQHALAKKQMRGFGGMLAIDLAGGEPAARALCSAVRIFSLGESLGGVESLIGYPWSMSHAAFPAEEKRRKGVTEATVRLSVGIEHADDLCEDLARGLDAAAQAG